MTFLQAGRIICFLLALSLPLSAQEPCQKRRIPPGQRVVENFPLLHYADIPDLDHRNWSLKVSGQVKKRIALDWQQFSRLETVKSVSDFHCVTGWTKLDLHWEGVRLRDLLDAAGLKKPARFITCT